MSLLRIGMHRRGCVEGASTGKAKKRGTKARGETVAFSGYADSKGRLKLWEKKKK